METFILTGLCAPQREKTYLLTCAPNEDESACTSAQSYQSFRCPHEEILHPKLSKMHPVKILIRLRECAGWSKSLQKQAYSNILKIWKFYHQKLKIFRWKKKMWNFSYFCSKNRLLVPVRTASPRRFNEYPQSMFLSRNKKNVYPCKPQFNLIKVGFKEVKIT